MKIDLTHLPIAAALIATAALLSACGGGLNASSSEPAPTSSAAQKASALADTSTTSTSWVSCAREGGACVFSGTRTVRYGTATKYYTRTATGSIACDNSVFGDPAFGQVKQCWYSSTATGTTAPTTSTTPISTSTSTSSTTWALCAYEGSTCKFSGTKQVRYGTVTRNVTRTFSNPVMCSNDAFGDPAYGVAKACWVAEQATTTTVNTTTVPTTSTTTVATGSTTTTSSGTTSGATSGTTTSAPTGGTTASTTTSGGGIPSPASIAGKPVVGRIVATTGQVIENVHVTTTSGPCIVVPGGVTNVTIRNSEIGPCGSQQGTIQNEGVQVFGSSVTVQRNVIHDVSTALTAYEGAKHPIVFDRNFVYNIRGPLWQGQMVQFGGVRGGSGSSKITCNVKDGLYGPAPVIGTRSNEDHISMYNSMGISNAQPIEIAYNRIRGNRNGSSQSGSGMMLGDSPAGGGGSGSDESGYYWVHHNTIVLTNGVGIGVAGGHDIRIENNRIDNRGESKADNTGWSFAARRFDTSSTGVCNNVSFANNRSTIARLWAFNNDGSAGQGIIDGGGCSFTSTGNNFNDTSLTSAMFDEPYAECN